MFHRPVAIATYRVAVETAREGKKVRTVGAQLLDAMDRPAATEDATLIRHASAPTTTPAMATVIFGEATTTRRFLTWTGTQDGDVAPEEPRHRHPGRARAGAAVAPGERIVQRRRSSARRAAISERYLQP